MERSPIIPIVLKAIREDDFKNELISNPIEVIEKYFGISLPDGFEIIVQEDTKDLLHLSIPYIKDEETMTDEQIIDQITAATSVKAVHAAYTQNA